MDGWQKLIFVAEVIFAELAGGVAHRFQHRRNGHRLCRQADRRACLADRGHAGADWQFPGDEVGPTCRTTCLGIVVRKQHALFGDLIQIGRPAGHHAAVIGSDIPHANVVAHDDNDVRFLLLLLRGCWDACHRHRDEQPQKAEPNCSPDHDRTPILFLIKSGTSRRARAGGWVYFIGDKRVSWTKGQQFTQDLYAGRCPLWVIRGHSALH